VSDADWPAFRVVGKESPEIEKPVPVTVAVLIVSGTLPADLSVRV
jgi:hypothetical protein